ncbi:Glucose N-acetyltransferase 1 [Cladobotryum mycophilum]|uniref:non-specific serine/threonine protein kinase n=1 Tax=Cladobotryum mycophilum TaxID=491253 RepID=A0ABR0T418_9HYPO
MEDPYKLSVIQENPIGDSLKGLHSCFASACRKKGVSNESSSIDKLDKDILQDLALEVLSLLPTLHASRKLPSAGRAKSLFADILRLNFATTEGNFDFTNIKPLFIAVLDEKPDVEIWEKDTPFRFASSGVVNSSELREFMDPMLQAELGDIWFDLDIYGTFFESVAGLKEAADIVFKTCCKGDKPLFDQGWRDWPDDTSEKNVIAWLEKITQHLAETAEHHTSIAIRQQFVGLPHKPLKGSVADRKLDVGFVNNAQSLALLTHHWSQILVPGELKKNSADDVLKTWLDLEKYVREVFRTQDTRRFVLGFTLCGPIMRIWNFDRIGAIGSTKLDVNQDGLQFVSVILGFLCMDREALGFDPTIIKTWDKRYIEIDHEGQQKRLILDRLMSRSAGIVTRGTTCWEAYLEGEPQVRMVLKDSWQPTERNEGELLRLATEKKVTNMVRHYYSETVQAGGLVDDVQNNIRKGLNVGHGKRTNRPQKPSPNRVFPARLCMRDIIQSRSAGSKRSSSQSGMAESSSKRHRSESPTKQEATMPGNRVHQRIIMRDYGDPIYCAESLAVLLESIAQCVGGHKALYDAGILHRDISLNNLLINTDRSDASHLGFLIDLDLAVKVSREEASGAATRRRRCLFLFLLADTTIAMSARPTDWSPFHNGGGWKTLDDDNVAPGHRSKLGDILSSRRTRLASCIGAILVLLLLLSSRSRTDLPSMSAWHQTTSKQIDRSKHTYMSPPADSIDWTRFAYFQYVTNDEYLCNSIMIFEALHQLGSKADRVLLYPFQMMVNPNSKEVNDDQTRLLIKARDEYNVRLKPVTVQRKANEDPTWASSYTKLLAFNQTQYDRVLSLDSDATVLQSMDELFLLPPCPAAMPRAYWLLPDENTLSSQLILVQPSAAEFRRVHAAIEDADHGQYDMEIVNTLYRDSAMVLPHRPYDMLSAEFRREQHEQYLGSAQEEWDPIAVYEAAKFVHFSDWPVPKPWIPMELDLREEKQPRCTVTKDGVENCADRDIWVELYRDFLRRRIDICYIE